MEDDRPRPMSNDPSDKQKIKRKKNNEYKKLWPTFPAIKINNGPIFNKLKSYVSHLLYTN